MSKRKKYRPKDISCNPIEYAIALAAKLDWRQIGPMWVQIERAVEDFQFGRGSDAAWKDLADAANTAEALMQYGLANDHAKTFSDAQIALRDVCERHNAGGSWTLRANELESLRLLLVVHKVQLENCSQREFRDAVRRVARRCAAAFTRGSNATVTTVKVAGQLGRVNSMEA